MSPLYILPNNEFFILFVLIFIMQIKISSVTGFLFINSSSTRSDETSDFTLKRRFCFINSVDNVIWQPQRDSRADVS